MTTLTLIASIAFSIQSSPEVAVGSYESLLKQFGVIGPFRLQTLGLGDGSEQSVGSIVVTDRDGARYTCYKSGPKGAIRAIYRDSESEALQRGLTHPLKDDRILRRVRGWISSMTGNRTLRTSEFTSDGRVGSAYFPILKNGYPFVGSGHDFGYWVNFSVPDVRFLRLTCDENLPEVDSAPPLLTEKQAVARLENIFTTEIAPENLQKHHWITSFKLGQSPTLGYYKATGDRLARLVWRIPYFGSRDVGYAIQGGTNAMLIDARTGKQVHTETVP